jgi:putative transposase
MSRGLTPEPGSRVLPECGKSRAIAMACGNAGYRAQMARRPRLLVPGGLYHVYSRGNRRQEIHLDAIDRSWFLERLEEVIALFEWRLHAYCLLPNHYHLMVETPKPNLSAGMHRLNFLTAQSFNRRHEVDGHLFQGRFHSPLVKDTPQAFELARYIVLNPVRAGLVKHPAAWRWSSYRAAVRIVPRPQFLTLDLVPGAFRPDPQSAEQAYERFVLERLADSSTAQLAA